MEQQILSGFGLSSSLTEVDNGIQMFNGSQLAQVTLLNGTQALHGMLTQETSLLEGQKALLNEGSASNSPNNIGIPVYAFEVIGESGKRLTTACSPSKIANVAFTLILEILTIAGK